jgi:hypothetical protein
VTRKVYRTAQGRTVDLGALQLKNENIRAVGNMSVNARGDLLDQWNRPIASRNNQVSKQYSKQTSNVVDEPVKTSSQDSVRPKKKQPREAKPQTAVPAPPEDFQDDFVKSQAVTGVAKPPIPEGGIASAMARARQISQEPLLTPKQVAQLTPGVKKI